MQARDPDHWLHRLSADEWLQAAANELARAEKALAQKQRRAGVTGARRAAGMAWNAVLATGAEIDPAYGRSYMDHLKALASDESTPEIVRASSRALLAAPLAAEVVQLGRGDTHLADSARAILDHARDRVSPHAHA